MQTIPINVAENGRTVPMSVGENGATLGMEAEQARVIGAVSPTVNVERTDEGVEITVHDIRGDQPVVTVYDGQQGPTGEQGPKGDDGDPGVGVPAGGTSGQVLAKSADGDFLTAWIDPPSGGPYMQYGQEIDDTGATGTYSDTVVTFPVPFKAGTVPFVLLGLGAKQITNKNAGQTVVWLMKDTVTNEGFTARFVNASTNNFKPTICWLAIGERA